MKDLTLVIPAKNEWLSLPKVLEELKKYKCQILIVLHKTDIRTIKSVKKYNHKIIKQHHNGYGDAIIEGVNSVQTKYFCIFNADGSFNPNDLSIMIKKIKLGSDFVFATRYLKKGGSDDDTIITFIGNKIFTLIGKIFFKIRQQCRLIFLSPIFEDLKNRKSLGIVKFNLLSKNFKVNFIALGGINYSNLNKVFTSKSVGIAGIRILGDLRILRKTSQTKLLNN